MFIFYLLLFICLSFLLDNLFKVCEKSVTSSIKLFFIIFQKVITFSILTTTIFIDSLSWLNIIEEI